MGYILLPRHVPNLVKEDAATCATQISTSRTSVSLPYPHPPSLFSIPVHPILIFPFVQQSCPMHWRIFSNMTPRERSLSLEHRASKIGLALGEGGEGFISWNAECFCCGQSGHWGFVSCLYTCPITSGLTDSVGRDRTVACSPPTCARKKPPHSQPGTLIQAPGHSTSATPTPPLPVGTPVISNPSLLPWNHRYSPSNRPHRASRKIYGRNPRRGARVSWGRIGLCRGRGRGRLPLLSILRATKTRRKTGSVGKARRRARGKTRARKASLEEEQSLRGEVERGREGNPSLARWRLLMK